MSISVGEVGLSGFRLIGRRPMTTLIWSVTGLAWLVAAFVAAALVGGGFAGATVVSPARMALMYLVLLPLLVLGAAVVYCAVYRSVLRPDESAFAYLRVGGDEFRMVGLFGLLTIIGLLALLGLSLAVSIAQAIVGTVASAVAGEIGSMVVAFLSILAFAAVMVWMAVRVSFAGPMTFATRKIQLGKAWEMTDGKFWPLFGAYVVSWLLAFVMLIASAVIGNLLVTAILGDAGFVQSGASTAAVIAAIVIYLVLQIASVGPSYAVLGAPPAEAYSRYAPRRDLAETFA